MQKYKIVIDYENEQLFIKKNTNLKTVNAIAFKPNQKGYFLLRHLMIYIRACKEKFLMHHF